jgi:hypothetical protein
MIPNKRRSGWRRREEEDEGRRCRHPTQFLICVFCHGASFRPRHTRWQITTTTQKKGGKKCSGKWWNKGQLCHTVAPGCSNTYYKVFCNIYCTDVGDSHHQEFGIPLNRLASLFFSLYTESLEKRAIFFF